MSREYAGKIEEPKHELIRGMYSRGGFDPNFRREVLGYYEDDKISLNEKLRTACKDLAPSLNEDLNRKRVSSVISLLSHGANPSEVDENGNNALMLLFEYSYRSKVAIDEEIKLAENGYCPDKVSGDYENYVWDPKNYNYAFENSDPQRYAEVCSQNNNITILHSFNYNKEELEAYRSNLEKRIAGYQLEIANKIVPLLLEKGVDVNAKNKEGLSALEIADKNQNYALTSALSDNGADRYDVVKNITRNPQYSYILDSADDRNIKRWTSFTHIIFNAVKNKINDISEYPTVTVNKDGSLSFFFDDSTLAEGTKKSEYLQGEHFEKSIEFYALKMGFNTKSKNGKIVELKEIDSEDHVYEYKINLTAEELDSIMMSNDQYRGYRNENSLLKLNKDFKRERGVIKLFPISKEHVGENAFAVMVSGCQTYEIPSVQLLRMLPDYEQKIAPERKVKGGYFHWMPKEVEDSLKLSRGEFGEILNKIFNRNGIVVTEGKSDKFYEYPESLIIRNREAQKDVRIVEIDEDTKDFYALYGLLNKKQLEGCLSVEIDSLAFLREIKNSESVRNNADATKTIDKMIAAEEKLVQPSVNFKVASGDNLCLPFSSIFSFFRR